MSVISEFDPIGSFKVTMVEDKKEIFINVRAPDGRCLKIWDMDNLANLRIFAEQRVTEGMPKEEADRWRDGMVEMVMSAREVAKEIFGPLLEELSRPPWYIRFWRWATGGKR
jgi:hypothetical protein